MNTLEEAFKQLNSYPLKETCKPFRISDSGRYWCASFVRERNVKNKDLGFNFTLLPLPPSGSHISFLYKEDAEEFKQIYGIKGNVYKSKELLTIYRVDKQCNVPVYISMNPTSVRKDISEVGQWYVDRMGQIFGESVASVANFQKIIKDYVKNKFKEFLSDIKSSYPGGNVNHWYKKYDVHTGLQDPNSPTSAYFTVDIDNVMRAQNAIGEASGTGQISMKIHAPIPKLNLQLTDVCNWEFNRSVFIEDQPPIINLDLSNEYPMQLLFDIVKKFVKERSSHVYSNKFNDIEYDVDSNIKSKTFLLTAKEIMVFPHYKIEDERQEFKGTITDFVDYIFLNLKKDVETFMPKLRSHYEICAKELPKYFQNELECFGDTDTSDFIKVDFDEVK